jgi:arginyl-tRNA synthetase
MIAPSELESTLRQLIAGIVTALPGIDAGEPPIVALESPRSRAHGDLACSAAMPLASRLRKPPVQIAQQIAEQIQAKLPSSSLAGAIASVEVKPPGFINFFLSNEFLASVLREIVKRGPEYGRINYGQKQKAMVEFVSANPTGPLSVAHGRQAAVGDALASVLGFAGYQVDREYYLNDEGTQIELLGSSLLVRAQQQLGRSAEIPENGYKGDYMIDAAKKWLDQNSPAIVDQPDAQKKAKEFIVKELTEVIRAELDRFGVKFSRWYPQSSLDQNDYLNQTLELLKKRGDLYEQEGAWWLRSTAYGDDKDRVVIRSDGRLTYIAADIAYHRTKFERGYQRLVNLLGPDHHGYIIRLKASVQAMGFDPSWLHVLIVQLCTLKRGEEIIPMSTREGKFTTLTEVMDEVGVDAARFFFLLRKIDAHLEFDLELAKKHSLDNPVYYIQYAHARISRIAENAAQEKISVDQADLALLKAPEERLLLEVMRNFPNIIELTARTLETYAIVAYLQELAAAFHKFYDAHRIIGSEPAVAAARLQLCAGVKTVLGNGLRLLGVSAPEKM